MGVFGQVMIIITKMKAVQIGADVVGRNVHLNINVAHSDTEASAVQAHIGQLSLTLHDPPSLGSRRFLSFI